MAAVEATLLSLQRCGALLQPGRKSDSALLAHLYLHFLQSLVIREVFLHLRAILEVVHIPVGDVASKSKVGEFLHTFVVASNAAARALEHRCGRRR